MSELRDEVRQVIAEARLLKNGDRVLVGVSGGPDSVTLLHLLAGLKDELGIALHVVHVDHQLRPDSPSDAAFVADLAHRWGLPVTLVERDVGAEADRRGLSLEDAARRIRYDAFLEVAAGQSANRLALAHTADDQAETVLMRLLRGTGISGLTAIPTMRPLGDEVTVIRPLLGVWRHEVLAYVAAHQLAVRNDTTNTDTRFLRNRIRAQLLPLLEREYNPNMKMLLGQLAEQCRTDATFLQAAAQRHWRRLVKSEHGQLAIRLAVFRKQPKALQRQLIRLAIREVQGDLAGFEFRHWVEVERLLSERPLGTILDLPGDLCLERGRDCVFVRRRAPPPSSKALLRRSEAPPSSVLRASQRRAPSMSGEKGEEGDFGEVPPHQAVRSSTTDLPEGLHSPAR